MRLRFTIPNIGGGLIGVTDIGGRTCAAVDDEGRATFARLIESTATLPEFAKRLKVDLETMRRAANDGKFLRPVVRGDFFDARYLKADLSEWWALFHSESAYRQRSFVG